MYQFKDLSYIVLASILCVLNVIGNGLVIFIIIFRQKGIRNRTSLYILSISIADFFVAFPLVPINILRVSTYNQ